MASDAQLPDGAPGADAAETPLVDAAIPDAALPDATIIPVDAAPDARVFNPPWADPLFLHRKKITITNVGTPVVPVGIALTFKLDLEVLPGYVGYNDFHLLRHSGGGVWTEVNRTIDDTDATDEPFWFKSTDALAANASSELWLYWGNPAAAVPPQSGSANFDFYEPFNDATLNTTRWVTQGTITTAAGAVVMDPAETFRSVARFADNNAVDFTMRATYGNRIWGGFQRESDFVDDAPWMIWVMRSTFANQIFPEIAFSTTAVQEGTKRAFTNGQNFSAREK